MKILVQAHEISKSFPGVRALDRVSFDIREGEVHSLCGENGAGKSTLMKIFSGLYPHGTYEGKILVRGNEQRFLKTSDSFDAGLAIVYQELSLVPELTVAENIFLGREPSYAGVVRRQQMHRQAELLLSRLGLDMDPDQKIIDLSIGERQLIEIAKALSHQPQVIILDEPTSALSQREVHVLLRLIKKLRDEKVGVVLISHKLDEVFELSDRITVLRDGQVVGSYNAQDLTTDRVVALMVGRELKDIYPQSQRNLSETILDVQNLSVPHPHFYDRYLLENISFTLKKGEILGIAGLMGSGRTELLMALFGALPFSGEVRLNGEKIKLKSPEHAIRQGLALASEDRKRFGLVLEDSVVKNITLSGLGAVSRFGVISPGLESQVGHEYRTRMRIKTASLETPAKNLSGGNQQKIVLSKCLLTHPKVLFLDEPTRGIDIGAKSEIYREIHRLAEKGLSIVMVSSELPEVLGVCDRILVLCEGRITGEYSKQEVSEEKVMSAATRFRNIHTIEARL